MYRKKELQPMMPYSPSMSMDDVSVSEADKLNGSPVLGDMIAVNPSDAGDRWLVAKMFFDMNYELVIGAGSGD